VSVQYGEWNFDERPPDREQLNRAAAMLVPYGPDGESNYVNGGVGIVFRAFCTSRESRSETRPLCLRSGAILTWDGRLDNREELLRKFHDILETNATDAAIVAAAYETDRTQCFARLIGDWALSVWEPSTRSLVLAKDPIGTRPLYYTFDQTKVVWSSILDALVLLAQKNLQLEEEYIAGWLTFFPATHLTPYAGVNSVPPSCFVRLTPGTRTVSKYWDFDPSLKIRYRNDRDYEEHFRQGFVLSVRRRLRCDGPVLAELSGGMDSSSIVCVADTLFSRGEVGASWLDTVSYYNDSEPNWNERPFFAKVEEKRGRAGCHIDVGAENGPPSELDGGRFAATPSGCIPQTKAYREFAAYLDTHGHRVLLSGVGGDEFTGGVPTPLPELADLLARARLVELARRLKAWALNKKQPWFHLLFDAASRFVPATALHKSPPSWLLPGFAARNRSALAGYVSRLKLFGPLPTFQENLASLDILRRQLACQSLPSEPHYERRYPYLDRTFLEFLCAIPREQLVRPGERRSLMKRALRDLVPPEILNRKRKAFVVRTPLLTLTAFLQSENAVPRAQAAGIVDGTKFSEAILQATQGQDISLVSLQRTVVFEHWLDQAIWHNLISGVTRSVPSDAEHRLMANATQN